MILEFFMSTFTFNIWIELANEKLFFGFLFGIILMCI